TLDATTQPGFSGMPLVEIDGSLAGEATFGILVNGNSSTIRGLVVNRVRGRLPDGGLGILVLEGGGNIIEGNFVGVDATGTADRANEYGDIFLYESVGNVVGGTVAA